VAERGIGSKLESLVGSGRGSGDATGVFAREGEAHGLADRLPDLVLNAVRIAQTVAHGIHGRRRAGPGETFWQFRQAQSGDSAQLIDWRRSGSSDHLYVREREWEAAHTVWLWPDISASMDFKSEIGTVTKRDRALVLTFALAELLVRGGERVALIGLSQPSANRKTTMRMAERLAAQIARNAKPPSLPPSARLSRFSNAVLISDFLDPIETISARIAEIAAAGVSGHLVQVLDPAEETLPYEGRADFRGLEDGSHWIADRVETLRETYRERFLAHREAIRAAAHRAGWSMIVHHTDRPATEPLLALIMKFQGAAGDYRWADSGQAFADDGAP
jgi:uncharacterized protein (DUF58 family)